MELPRQYTDYDLVSRMYIHGGGAGHCWRWVSSSQDGSFFCYFLWSQTNIYVSMAGQECTVCGGTGHRSDHGRWWWLKSKIRGTTAEFYLDDSESGYSRKMWSGNFNGYLGRSNSWRHVGISLHQGSTVSFDNFKVVADVDVPFLNGKAVPQQFITAGSLWQFSPPTTWYNENGQGSLSFTTEGNLPSWLSFSTGQRKFSGTPAPTDVGEFDTTIKASSSNGGCVTTTFHSTVYAGSCPLLKAVSRGGSEGYARLEKNGVDMSENGQGFNIAVFNEDDYEFVAARWYDVANGQGTSMIDYLTALPTGRIVLVATKGTATNSGQETVDADLMAELRNLGAANYWPKANGAFAMIGRKGAPPGSVPVRSGVAGDGEVFVYSMFTCAAQSRESDENEPADSEVGAVVRTNRDFLPFGIGAFTITPANPNFFVDETGQVRTTGVLSYEQGSTYALNIVVRETGFQSEWFAMQAQQGADSFTRLEHKLTTVPGRVRVVARAIDGPNVGLCFESWGVAPVDDDLDGYGGLVSAYDEEYVNIWAPSANNNVNTGRIVYIGDQYATAEYRQKSIVAQVQVGAWLDRSADWDSGWFELSSQNGGNSFKEVSHGLGELPDRVRVQIRSRQTGRIYEAFGVQPADDDGADYGGAIFSYSADKVRIWAPDRSNGASNGYLVYVHDGWAGTTNAENAHTADVRVQCWKQLTPPDFDSGLFDMTSFQDLVKDVRHGLGALPQRVSVQIFGVDNQNFAFEPAGSSWPHANRNTGGVIFGYDENVVRLYTTIREGDQAGLAHVLDGWGGEQHTQNSLAAKVRVRVWKLYTGMQDSTAMDVTILDVEEPPVPEQAAYAFDVDENSGADVEVGTITSEDDDGDDLTYTIASGNTDSACKLSAIDGTTTSLLVRTSSALNFESKRTFDLVINVDDGESTVSIDVTVTINDVNEQPTMDPTSRDVVEGTLAGGAVGAELVASDPDIGQTLTYAIVGGNTGDTFRISACSGAIVVLNPENLDHETSPTFTLTIRVSDDGSPVQTLDVDVTINVKNLNDPPVFVPQEREVDENSAVGDPVGEPLDFSDEDPDDDHTWEITSGNDAGLFAIDDDGQITVAKAELDYEGTLNVYQLRVEVSDDGLPSLSTEAAVTVTLLDVNDAPHIEAPGGEIIRFTGENADVGSTVGFALPVFDQDVGQTVTLSWAAGDNGNDGDSFGIDNDELTLVVADNKLLDFETKGEWTLSMVATDDGDPVRQLDFEVNVVLIDMNEAPIFPDYTRSVNENTALDSNVGQQVLATDVDAGQSLTYTIIDGNDAGSFSLSDPSTPQLVVAGPIDFETTPSFRIEIHVEDNGMPVLDNTAHVDITVVDVNEAPSIDPDSTTVSIDENSNVGTAAGTPLVVTDPDAGDTHVWAFVGEGGLFEIDEGTGQLSLAEAQLNYEAKTFYRVVVVVTDLGGAPGGLTDQATVTINVNDVNDPPVFDATTAQTVGVREDASNGDPFGAPLTATDQDGDVLTYSITAGNDDIFGVDDAGQLFIQDNEPQRLEVSEQSEYDLTITVSDGEAVDTVDVTIEITNVNKPPEDFVCGGADKNVPENSAPSTPVGNPLTATEPDAVVDGQTIAFSIQAGNTENAFAVDATTGQITVNADVLDFEKQNSYTLTYVATDDAPAPLSTTCIGTITIDPVDEAPVLDDEIKDQAIEIDENVPEGTPVGDALVAVDEDAGQTATLTFTILSATGTADSFAIDQVSGQVSVGPAGLDYERDEDYDLVLRVTDTDGLFDETTMTVAVQNVNERPYFDQAVYSVGEIAENSDIGLVVPTVLLGDQNPVLATDPDTGDVLTYTLTFDVPLDEADVDEIENLDGAFVVDPVTGIFSVGNNVLDYETNPLYTIPLVATDAGGLNTTCHVLIRIEDLDDITITDVRDSAGNLAVIPTDGGTNVDISGSNFGPMYPRDGQTVDVVATYGPTGVEYTARECFVLTPNVAIRCTSVPGVGTGHIWTVSINGGIPHDSGDITSSYEVPRVESVLNANGYDMFSGEHRMRTEGGEEIILVGTGFPVPYEDARASDLVVAVTYGDLVGTENTARACEAENRTHLRCLSSPGTKFSLMFIVTVGGQTSFASPPLASYSLATVSNVVVHTSSGALRTAGGEKVTITGDNFGPLPSTAYLEGLTLWGVSGGPITQAPGDGGNFDGSAGGSAGDFERLLTGVDPFDRAARRLGHPDASVDDDDYYLPDGEDASDSGGDHPTGPGDGAPAALDGASYGPNGDPYGGTKLAHFSGLYVTYGPTGSEYLARGCRMLEAHRKLQCLSVPGLGTGHVFRVRVGSQTGPQSSAAVDYLAPSIQTVTGPGAHFASTVGGQSVLISGANYGLVAFRGATLGASYGPTGTEYTAVDCRVTTDNNRISCSTAPGTGTGHAWKVWVEGQESDVANVATNYAPPIVSHFVGVGSSDALTQGGQAVDVHGHNFGFDGDKIDWVMYSSDLLAVRGAEQGEEGVLGLDSTFMAVNCSIQVPHTVVRCWTAPGAGESLRWVVSVDGQTSSSPMTNYGAPQLHAVTDASGNPFDTFDSDGGETVLLHGINFGPLVSQDEFLEGVVYGSGGAPTYSAANCAVTVDSVEITCTTVPGTGTELQFQVSVEGQTSVLNSSLAISYEAPELIAGAPGDGPTDGGTEIRLLGRGFGLLDPLSSVVVNFGAAVLVPDVFPDSTNGDDLDGDLLTVTLPTGSGASVAVDVTVTSPTGEPRSVANPDERLFFAYRPPHIDSSTTEQLPDGVSIVVRGENFGSGPGVVNEATPSSANPVVTVNGHVASQFATDANGNPTWTHRRFEMHIPQEWLLYRVVDGFTVPAGDIRINVGGQESNTFNFTHFSPSLQPIGLDALSAEEQTLGGFYTEGGSTLTIRGNHFGAVEKVRVFVGGALCADPHIDNVTGRVGPPSQHVDILTCTMPPGEGLQRSVVVWRDQLQSTEQYVDYQLPKITTVDPEGDADRVPTHGTEITIHGTSFGTHDVAVYLEPGEAPPGFGAVRLDVVESTQSYVTAVLPPGQGLGYRLAVRQSWQSLLGDEEPFYGKACSDVCPDARSAVDVPPHQIVGCDPQPCLSSGCTWSEGQRCTVYASSTDGEYLTVDYDAPRITNFAPRSGPTQGGNTVTLVGENFGLEVNGDSQTFVHFCRLHGSSAEVELEGVQLGNDFGAWEEKLKRNLCRPCEVTAYTHTSISCRAPRGAGSGDRILVTVAKQSRWSDELDPTDPSRRMLYGYDSPVIDWNSMYPNRTDTRGGVNVTLRGANFGSFSPDLADVVVSDDNAARREQLLGVPQVIMQSFGHSGRGGGAAGAVLEFTDNKIVFVAPAGMGSANDVFVVMPGAGQFPGARSNAVPFWYNPPRIHTIDTTLDVGQLESCCSTGGGYRLRILGESLGRVDAQRVFISKYTEPEPVMSDELGTPTNWRECVVLNSNGKALAETTEEAFQEWRHDEVVCRVPPGIGDNLKVVVYTSELNRRAPCGAGADFTSACGDDLQPMFSEMLTFSYDPPVLSYFSPDPVNALGEAIEIWGQNLGSEVHDEEYPKQVTINGVNCTDPFFRDRGFGGSYLTCLAPPQPVGYKNVTINVAFQSLTVWDDAYKNYINRVRSNRMVSYCELGHYGDHGEECLECPSGAICEHCATHVRAMPDGSEEVFCVDERINEPYSDAGWWNGPLPTHCSDPDCVEYDPAGAPNDLCDPKRLDRVYCPNFIPCEPKLACKGNNTCNEKYTGDRCSLCSLGHYRMDGECIECPDNPWLLVIGFVIVACFACLGGYGACAGAAARPRRFADTPPRLQC